MKPILYALILFKAACVALELLEPVVYWLADVADERLNINW